VSSVGVLVRHHVRLHRMPLVPLAVGLAAFEWIMTIVAGQPSVSRFLTSTLNAAPPQLLALLNQDLVSSISAQGIVGVGYSHPFALLMMAVIAVRVPSAALAGEIGRRTMDLMAARPVLRVAHVTAALAAVLAGLGILAVAAYTGTLVGLGVRPVEGVSALRYAPVALQLWLLFACWGAIGIAVSALCREAGQAIAWTSGLMAGSFVLDYAARVWPTLAPLRPLSLFRYYEPQRVVSAGLALHDVVVPAAVGAAAILLAFVVFARRDL
jgi:ABC-2 type transport system permease protein